MENENINANPRAQDAHSSTPAGETGINDLRESMEHQGKGRVADAAGVHSNDVESKGMPDGDLTDEPSADDPYGTTPESAEVREMQKTTDGPTYERGQGTADPSTGGSTDPHNFMTHANSNDETES